MRFCHSRAHFNFMTMIVDISTQLKAKTEAHSGKSFSHFTAKSYTKQVVAGTNYFIKVARGQLWLTVCGFLLQRTRPVLPQFFTLAALVQTALDLYLSSLAGPRRRRRICPPARVRTAALPQRTNRVKRCAASKEPLGRHRILLKCCSISVKKKKNDCFFPPDKSNIADHIQLLIGPTKPKRSSWHCSRVTGTPSYILNDALIVIITFFFFTNSLGTK